MVARGCDGGGCVSGHRWSLVLVFVGEEEGKLVNE